MNSSMDRHMHHECVQRAIALGRGTDPAVLSELVGLLKMPSAEIRRLAASAIGKLSGFGADPATAVAALAPAALRDPHPQVQQYAMTALKAYGVAAVSQLHDINDLAGNPRVRDYVRKAAASAARVVLEAQQIAARLIVHTCLKCGAEVSDDEYARSWKAFQRAYCDKCFDEVYIEYWGMDTADYKIGMLKKQKLYQQKGKRVISLYPADKSRLGEVLRGKLSKYARLPASASGIDQVRSSVCLTAGRQL